MDQKTYDELLAERAKRPVWPLAQEAKAYLTAKGFVERVPGKWDLPSADHTPTAKQQECLRVLKATAAKPARQLTAEAGKLGA